MVRVLAFNDAERFHVVDHRQFKETVFQEGLDFCESVRWHLKPVLRLVVVPPKLGKHVVLLEVMFEQVGAVDLERIDLLMIHVE